MSLVQSKYKMAVRLRDIEESATMRVMVAARNLKAKGVDVLDLGAGEPDFDTPSNIKEAAKRAIDENFTRYTPATGVPELRDAILFRFREDFGLDRKPNEVIATVGGKQAIFNAVMALINPGDEVIIPAPYWVSFPPIVSVCDGKPVIVQTSPGDGFQLTADLVRSKLTPRTRMIILNSPCNPTGAVIPDAEFQKICELAAEREIYVLSDECYLRFRYDGTQGTAASLPEPVRSRVVVAGSLSKTYAMTGWRLGYAIGPAEVIAQMSKIQSHQTSNPTSITQAAAIEALKGPQESVSQMIGEYRKRRDYLVGALNAIPGIRCFKPEGAFYVFPEVKSFFRDGMADSTEFAARLLEEAHIAVTPGIGFGTEGFIRISYAAAYEDLEAAVGRLRSFLSKL